MNNSSANVPAARGDVAQPTLESADSELVAQTDLAAPSPSSVDFGVAELEFTSSWVAESRSAPAVGAYIVLAAMLTTIAMGVVAIVMLVHALN